MNKTLTKCRKNNNDIFYTPSDLVLDCLKLIDIKDDDILLDPFFGNGAFFNEFPRKNKKEWCEIEKGVDFFKYNKKVDWIISNPPFSKLTQVLEHSTDICKKGFGLIMMTTALSVKRINDIKKKGFYIIKIHWFSVKSWFGFPCVFVVFSREGEKLFDIDPAQYK